MRILFFIILCLLISSNSYSAQLIDCSQLKFIAKLNCKTKNLKSRLNEKQAETKEKISKTAKDLKSKVENK